jgi:hypothetical protein
MLRIDLDRQAIEELARRPEMAAFITQTGAKVRAQAQQNARAAFPGSDRASAHGTYSGVDEQGVYTDVGYTRGYYGFVLWWSEVGTSTTPVRPMLRQALQQIRL